MDKESGFVFVEERIRLYYEKVGNGPCVIIPNGFYFFEELKRFADARTIIVYDVRNRGLSDAVSDPSKLRLGILQDVQDLYSLKRQFNLNSFTLIGHSYIGLMVMLYAKQFPADLNRAILIGPPPPDAHKTYGPPLTNNDGVITEVFSKIREMQSSTIDDPVEACKRFWSVLRRLYVYRSEDAEKITWGRCDLSTERNFMKYWTDHLFPSIQNIRLTPDQLKEVTIPVLVIHGDKDRSAPYGGARDWAAMLSNARLLTFTDVAHAPWIEAPAIFFEAVQSFLDGNWPPAAAELS